MEPPKGVLIKKLFSDSALIIQYFNYIGLFNSWSILKLRIVCNDKIQLLFV